MTGRDAILQSIEELKLTASDDESVAELLADVAALVGYPTGTELFAEGEHHSLLYFILQGTASLEMVTTSCGKQRLLTVGAGDLLAWSTFVGDGRMTSTATALEPMRLLAFDSDSLKTLCSRNHEVGFVMMSRIAQVLARRLIATRLQLLDLYHIDHVGDQ